MGESAMREQSLDKLIIAFLTDMAHANRSLHTRRAYATDLAQLCAYHQGTMQTVTAEVLRAFFEAHLHLSPATRARKQTAVACFLTWAYQHELIDNNPMLK
jgi:integrase/recombinase XerD